MKDYVKNGGIAQIKSWTVSDELWGKIERLVPGQRRKEGRCYKRKPGSGRKPLPARQIFEAIVYVLRTGIQWKALPREFGSASVIHKHFMRWEEEGFFEKVRKVGLGRIRWDAGDSLAQWQSVDMGLRARHHWRPGCVGANPTDRGKKRGRKRSVLCDARGVPLPIVADGSNRHELQALGGATLENKMVPMPGGESHLCADAAYKGKALEEMMKAKGYVPQIRGRSQEREEKKRNPEKKARRWVVERTLLMAEPVEKAAGEFRENTLIL